MNRSAPLLSKRFTLLAALLVLFVVLSIIVNAMRDTNSHNPGVIAEKDASQALHYTRDINEELDPNTITAGDLLTEHPGALPEPLGIWEQRDGKFLVVDIAQGPNDQVLEQVNSEILNPDLPTGEFITPQQSEAAWHVAERLHETFNQDLTVIWPSVDGWEAWDFTTGNDGMSTVITTYPTRDEALDHTADGQTVTVTQPEGTGDAHS